MTPQSEKARGRRRLPAVWTCVLAIVLAGPIAQPRAQLAGITDPAVTAKLDPLLQQRLAGSTGASPVIVRARDADSLAAVAALVEGAGGTVGRRLPILDAQAALLPDSSVLPVASSPLVLRIALDRPVFATLERTAATIGAAAVRQTFGLDGRGVTIAVIDSGVTSWHDDLQGDAGGQRVTHFVDFVDGAPGPYDDHGHGTHVAGIIAGNGHDSMGGRAGIAPAAGLAVLKVLDSSGRGRISDVIAALDYVVSRRHDLSIRIVNLSIGAGVAESYDSDLLTLAARRAVESGIVVVAAAGNNGTRDGGVRYKTITAPGNAPWVLTVGASSHNGTVDRADDRVASFSSRGPAEFDYAAKPDLLAPGVGIESLSVPSSTLYTSRPGQLLDGLVPTGYRPYLALSGTSQATPVVAGVVALMLQAAPGLTPNLVKAILQYTARPWHDYDALTQGAGLIEADGAIELTRALAASPSAPPASRAEWARSIIWGNHRIWGGYLTGDANAWRPEVAWGQDAVDQEPVSWGLVQSAGLLSGTTWTPWSTTCADPACELVLWDGASSDNVVWGDTCGGADCANAGVWASTSSDPTTTAASDGDTIVWGTYDNDTIVWGTYDNETIVWGTYDEETIVWGTSDEETIVWGTTCGESGCVD